MKKIFLTMVVAVMAITASAQVYVGGAVGLSSQGTDVKGDDDVTTWKFVPEVGYSFNQDWAAGVAFGWEGSDNGVKTVSVSPYARYTFVHTKLVNAFIDGGVGYGHVYGAGNDADAFEIGLRPGVAVNLSDHLSFVTHFGFIGYQSLKNNNSDVTNHEWGVDFDARNLTFGLYYSF